MKGTKLLYDNKKNKAKEFSSINPTIAEILINRGIETEEEARDFIEKKSKCNYGEIKGIKKASEIIGNSIKNNEAITIYSDTDVDGCMSAAAGMKLLKKVTDKIHYYTNNKFTDGYGLCKTGIDNILKLYPDTKLVITADNGIAATEGTLYAKQKGLKVVITDHHEPPKNLPIADVIVDPKQIDDQYKFKELCGAGVLYKVLKETYVYLGLKAEEADFVLDLVAFATVADIVPLIKENRMIVDKGLKIINEKPSITFKTIKEVLNINEISSHSTIAFLLAPMINSLSRMTGSINRGVELFLSEDKNEMIETINFMKEKNEQRKKITEEMTEKCKRLLDIPLKPKVIIIEDESFHEGVVGIVAGKLKEEFNRPTIILKNIDGELLRGSARSIDNFPLKDILDKIQNKTALLEQYGGHKKAAGLTIKKENLQKFIEAINIEADNLLTEDDLKKKVVIDATLTSNDLSIELIQDIEKIGPFGEGFPEPVIGINFTCTDVYKMGNDKQHLKCYDRFTDTSVIVWNGSETYDKIKNFKKKAIGTLSINEFKSKKFAQLIVINDLIF